MPVTSNIRLDCVNCSLYSFLKWSSKPSQAEVEPWTVCNAYEHNRQIRNPGNSRLVPLFLKLHRNRIICFLFFFFFLYEEGLGRLHRLKLGCFGNLQPSPQNNKITQNSAKIIRYFFSWSDTKCILDRKKHSPILSFYVRKKKLMKNRQWILEIYDSHPYGYKNIKLLHLPVLFSHNLFACIKQYQISCNKAVSSITYHLIKTFFVVGYWLPGKVNIASST